MQNKIAQTSFWTRLGLWLTWMLVLIVSAASLFLIYFIMGISLKIDPFEAIRANLGRGFNLNFVVVGILYAALAGSFQLAALRKRIDEPGWWFFATFIGAIAGWIILAIIPPVTRDWIGGFGTIILYPMAVSGVLMSAGQWWTIHNKIKNSIFWLLANILGWAITVILGLIFWNMGLYYSQIILVIVGLAIISAGFAFVFDTKTPPQIVL